MQHFKLPGMSFKIPSQSLEQAADTCMLLRLQLWIKCLKSVMAVHSIFFS